MSAESKYNDELSRLALARHGRNPKLVTIALLGLASEHTPQRIYNDVMSNCGTPRLGDREVTKAIKHAENLRATSGGFTPSRSAIRLAQAEIAAGTATEEERRFVADVIALCPRSSSKRLMELSPVPVAGLSRIEQAQLYCTTVFPDYRFACFTCDGESIYRKRTRDTMIWPEALFKEVSHGRIPTYCIANQFTGNPDRPPVKTGDGDFDYADDPEASFANTRTLATRRLTLIEFDSMPLEKQVRFWTAIIVAGLMPGLRTLVYSGGKSIHALVRIGDEEITPVRAWPDDELDFCWPKDARKEDPEMAWKRAREQIARLFEQSADEALRSDRACKDPTRLTRFGGGVRIGKDGKRVTQRLLWCADVLASDFDSQTQINGYGRNGEYNEEND